MYLCPSAYCELLINRQENDMAEEEDSFVCGQLPRSSTNRKVETRHLNIFKTKTATNGSRNNHNVENIQTPTIPSTRRRLWKKTDTLTCIQPCFRKMVIYHLMLTATITTTSLYSTSSEQNTAFRYQHVGRSIPRHPCLLIPSPQVPRLSVCLWFIILHKV